MSTVITVSLGAYSLPYAGPCIRSLAENLKGDDPIHLLTDTPDDVVQMQKAFAGIDRIKIHLADELWEDPANPMRKYPGLERLRAEGHPCWRKLTDPMLLAKDGDEVVVVDPDVYFPRPFSFEPVGDGTLRLMWQKPNCLLPASVVEKAFAQGIAMADHVDIGVAQYRSPLDLQWFDELVEKILDGDMPRMMHVEAILWSCFAMRMGGGYLDSEHYQCWHNSSWKRIRLKTGATHVQMLNGEDFRSSLAFHGGGTAKKWLAKPGGEDVVKQRSKLPGGKPLGAAKLRPFVPFTQAKFDWLKKRGRILDKLGFYKLMGGKPL